MQDHNSQMQYPFRLEFNKRKYITFMDFRSSSKRQDTAFIVRQTKGYECPNSALTLTLKTDHYLAPGGWGGGGVEDFSCVTIPPLPPTWVATCPTVFSSNPTLARHVIRNCSTYQEWTSQSYGMGVSQHNQLISSPTLLSLKPHPRQ